MENYEQDIRNRAENEANEAVQTRLENRSGRMLAGLIVVIVGSLLLARQIGVDIPWWLFSWKTLLIAIGLFVGAKHSFRGIGWIIPILVGSVFLLEDFIPSLSFKEYVWPIAIIAIGLFMIARPRRHGPFGRHRRHRRRDRWGNKADRWERWENITTHSSNDAIDVTSVFGNAKKIIISKDFKGGDITTLFGGADLDLLQADINGTVTIDVTTFFGGTKLIVPPNWNIKSDVVCVFGSIEDKRTPVKDATDHTKVLRLDGTVVFGGIEIKNY